MCQQYMSFYPEVVKKPEIFKTAAIFYIMNPAYLFGS